MAGHPQAPSGRLSASRGLDTKGLALPEARRGCLWTVASQTDQPLSSYSNACTPALGEGADRSGGEAPEMPWWAGEPHGRPEWALPDHHPITAFPPLCCSAPGQQHLSVWDLASVLGPLSDWGIPRGVGRGPIRRAGGGGAAISPETFCPSGRIWPSFWSEKRRVHPSEHLAQGADQ